MFYLDYRPKTISEIDTKQVRQTLSSMLGAKKIPHCVLLIGSKGLGKTSSARIIARAINCLNNSFAGKGTSFEPCNNCQICTSVSSSGNVDVVEMDAASNRKIDDIRALLEKVYFTPIVCRYKVYIIDEVHMLTTESFNALLKTLEEPPAQTIFILATTEYEKVPKTILSRSMHIAFPKAKAEDIVHMLKRIAASEKINISDEVLYAIANRSENSFRDGAKLLEQLSFEKEYTIEKLNELVGISHAQFDLLRLLQEKKTKEALEAISTYSQHGGSCRTLIETYLTILHNILLEKAGISTDQKNTYDFSLVQITKLIRVLQEAYNASKYAPIESLPLEVAIVEYTSVQ